MPLRRATLAEQAYEELRARIVSGALPAGRRLLAEELAQDLAISQTPVKEALALLERDGLVEGNPRRGSVVRRFTTVDVHHIFDARMLLEVQALRQGFAAGTITRAFIAEVADVFDRQLADASRHQPVVFAEAVLLDREFHETLIRLADNPVLLEWHRGVLRQTMTILTYTMETYDAVRAHGEHAAILDALRTGRLERMEAAMRLHLREARIAVLDIIETHGRDAG